MVVEGHELAIALFRPEIAPNTGNVGRLCVAAGAALHLVRPFGFVLSDKAIRRSGMDYWDRLNLTVHDDDEAFYRATDGRRAWLFSSKAERLFWDADFARGDLLIFGNESKGLPASAYERFDSRQVIRIPQTAGERCLNLSTAVGIGLYEAIRRVMDAE